MLTFPIAAVREVIARGNSDARANGGFHDPHLGLPARNNERPGLWLVGDHGVYIMSNGKLAEGIKPLVVCADECDPVRCDDWIEVKRLTFGDDDGMDFLEPASCEALIAAAPGGTHLRTAIIKDATQLYVINGRV